MGLSPEREAHPIQQPCAPAATDPGLVAAWLRMSSDLARTGSYLWQAATDTLSWESAATRQWLGRPAAEVAIPWARFVAEAVHPEDVEGFRQGWRAGLAAGRFTLTTRCRDGAGLFPRVEWRGEVIRGPRGEPSQVVGIVFGADPARSGETQRRLAIDAVPALISYVDRDFRYVSVNEAYRSWFGQDPQTLIGKTVADVVGAAALSRLKPHMERALAGERQRFEGSLPYQWGGSRVVELSYTPDEPDATGQIPGFVVLGFDVSERKRLEQLTRASEERWRGLFEAMAEGFVLAELLFDPATGRASDFRFLELNPAFETLTGFPVATTLGKTIRAVAPAIEDELIQIYARVVATRATERFEILLPSHQNQWFEATARHVEGATFSVLFNQITARKLAEAEAIERERKQAALLTLGDRLRDLKTVEAITLAAMEILGTTLRAIRAGFGRFEADQEQLAIETDWHDPRIRSIVGTYRLADYGQIGDLLRNQRTVVINDIRTDPLTARDVERWRNIGVEAIINIPIIEAGRLSAMFYVKADRPRIWTPDEIRFVREVADRTWATVERARVAEELAVSGERFRQLANITPQVLWTATPAGAIDFVSDQHYLNTGLVKGNDSPAAWTSVIHPDDLPNSLRVWGRAIATGQAYEVHQRIVDARSGGYRWHLTRALPTRDATGQITKWLGSNTDIDDQKRSEAAVTEALDVAEAANRMKDEFLATLSHELRTPLNAIVGWARILQGPGVDAEDLAEGLDAIERNGQVQSRLIEDLLDVSRIVSGNLRLDIAPVDLPAVVEAAIAVVGPAAQAKQIRVLPALDAAVGPISGDSARLQQVFWNLITNAVKFTPKGGLVQVSLARVESRVEVRVVDSGIGIPPEFLPQVFDRFRQADGSTTRRHGGLGLGLAIVKHLVEMHGGSITALSPGVDGGSTFVVRLPIAAVLDQAPAVEPDPRLADRAAIAAFAPASLAGLRILVVDDEPDARQMIRRALVECQAEVVLAASVAEALAQVERFRPDVILSDVGMPDADGYDLIRQVRALTVGHDIAAIALTAFAREEDRTRALRAGFQLHMAKPINPAELTAAIAGLVGRSAPPG